MARTVLPASCLAQRAAEPDRLPDMQAPTRNAIRAPASAIGGIGNRRGNRLDNQADNSDARFAIGNRQSAIGNRQKTELPVMERWSLMPAPSPQIFNLASANRVSRFCYILYWRFPRAIDRRRQINDPQGANGRYYLLAGAVRGSGKVLGKRVAQRRGYTNMLTSRPHSATEARRLPVLKLACPQSPVLHSLSRFPSIIIQPLFTQAGDNLEIRKAGMKWPLSPLFS